MRRWMWLALGAVAVVAVVGGAVWISSPDEDGSGVPASGPASAAERFFDRYVEADGRVVRPDDGDDTVSEGQGYAMLLAVAHDDIELFDRVWTWTRENLQRDDGLFAWHWDDGRVVDDTPAADADLDIASALLRASELFGRDELRQEAARIGNAALEHETVTVTGEVVLVAGPWAVDERIVNPSYLAPCDYDQFATVTGDATWSRLRDDSLELLDELLAQGLPPDWLMLDASGEPRPIAAPDDRDGEPRYGLDAARVAARLAACPSGQPLAAELWPRLSGLADGGAALSYGLDGHVLTGGTHPLGLVAAALAADAANEPDRVQELMDRATALERQHSTYYGAAWIALGYELLDGPTAQPARVPSRTSRSSGVTPTSTTVPPEGASEPTTAPTTTLTGPTTTGATPSPTTTTAAPATTSSSTSGSTSGGATTTSSATPTTSISATTTTVAASATDPAASATPTDVTDTTVAGEEPPASVPGDHGDRGDGDDDGSTGVIDLAPSPPDLDQFRRPAAVASDAAIDVSFTTHEPWRRRTAAVSLTGGLVVVMLGAAFGLRERAIVRKRSMP